MWNGFDFENIDTLLLLHHRLRYEKWPQSRPAVTAHPWTPNCEPVIKKATLQSYFSLTSIARWFASDRCCSLDNFGVFDVLWLVCKFKFDEKKFLRSIPHIWGIFTPFINTPELKNHKFIHCSLLHHGRGKIWAISL